MTAHGRHLEPWEQFEFSPNAWAGLFDEIRLDIQARRDIFNLAQRGPEGRNSATDVVHKILKRISDNDPPRNWGSWTHSNCLEQFHKLMGGQ